MKKADISVEKYMLFFFGAAIGALLFLVTYGTAILDTGYDAWILRSPDLDIKQHYIGFLHYLDSPWTFPVGMMDSLSYPHRMSVVWTDSIPGFCLLAKIFRFALPDTPQLFGIFGILTFALNGGFASLLIHRVTGSRMASIFASPFFILSFTVLQRLYYHTALSCHWIILAALLYFYSEKKYDIKRDCLVYGIFSVICVSVHSYFLPMAGGILLFDTIKSNCGRKKTFPALLPLISFCLCGLFALYFYGAFSSPVDHGGFAIGEFNSNLNTLFNSLGDGILPGLPNVKDTQYEGFGYLGLGMLLMALTALILLIYKVIKLGIKESIAVLKRRYAILLTVVMALFFAFIAVFPELDFNDRVLFPDIVPYPIKVLLGVFRSNGRFIWPLMYLIMISSLYVIFHLIKKYPVIYSLLIACILLQAADLKPYMTEKSDCFRAEYGNFCLLERYGPDKDSYDHIIMTYDNGDMKMDMGYFSALNDKTVNRFYFARGIDAVVDETLEGYKKAALAGKPEPRSLFVFNAETLKEWEDAPLEIEKVTDDLYFGY